MELRLKMGNFIKTASNSSPRSTSESEKKSPDSGTDTQSSYRLDGDFCKKLQIDLGYLTRDELNLDPQKTLEQHQNGGNTTVVEMNEVISDSNNMQRNDHQQQPDVMVDETSQGTDTDANKCCHCIVS